MKKRCRGRGNEEKVTLNVTLVIMVKLGCQGTGVHIKDSVPVYIMDWEWGGG